MAHHPKLDLSSFQQALNSLDIAVQKYSIESNNLFVRDATIQRFEYTYELAHKMLKRYLELSEPNAEIIDQMSFPDLIRTASERGLILNAWDTWKLYRDARNITSHTYSEKKAIQVCSVIPLFLNEAQHLLLTLQKSLLTL